MPRSARPRKPHRAKPIGRPVLEKMRADLILPAHAMLNELRESNDQALLKDAWHQLAATLSYMHAACAGREAKVVIAAGKDALVAVIERQERTGKWRCTGPELTTLRAAVATCDWELPYLRTDQITSGITHVMRALPEERSQA